MKSGRAIQYSLIWSFIIFTAIYFAGGYASAASVTLAWDANEESQLAGYNLYYHPCPAGEQEPVDQQNPNICIKKLQLNELSNPSQPAYEANGLEDNQNYAFAVTAYTTDGQESGLSNTVHYQTPENQDSTGADQIIINNGDPGTSYTGTWKTSGGVDPWEGDSLWARGGDTYTWSFTPAKTGTYEVSMWWTQYNSRSKSVPVSINDSKETHNIHINQQTNGGQWNLLGKYAYKAGVTYSVTITSQSKPTSTCADAVKIAYVDSNVDSDTPSPFVIDNGDPGTSYTGTWKTSGGEDPWETDSIWARGGDTYTWTFTPDITGTYDISMWWTRYASRSKSIPVCIDDSAGIHTVRIDQQTNGGKWNSLGTYSYKAGVSYAVTITSQSEPTSTCADAVKFTLNSADSGTTSTSSLQSETDQSRATASSSLGTASAVSVSISAVPAMEIGEVDIDHNWTLVVLGKSFVDPVVVATPASLNNAAPAVVRIRNIKSDSFEIRLQEWDYLDGIHPLETIGYVVMESGSYSLADGTRLEANYFQTDGTGIFQPVLFEHSFQEAPVVIASVSSFNENDAVTGRLRTIDTEGFEYRLHEQEAGDGSHAEEMIAYIAWQPSSGNLNGFSYEVNRTNNVINNEFFTIDFQTVFTSAPVFLCDMQTSNDEETANLRWRNKSSASLEVRVDEEISLDSEVDHANETVGYIVIE